MDIDQVRKEAKKYFSDAEPAHDWHHVKRVEKLAEKIAEKEGADSQVVKLGAILHDIGRSREDRGEIDDHAKWGAREASEILGDAGFSTETIKQVRHCVRSHRYSNSIEPETVEAEVVSDADNLDAMGATGIARTFAVCGERGSVMADPELPVEEDSTEEGETSLNHLQKKILDLENRMYTDTGKSIAAERHSFVEDFVQRMKEELR
ncbi:MAG: HD domain-containing protein, partial [Candidatus Nanohaloarchaea archaeon]